MRRILAFSLCVLIILSIYIPVSAATTALTISYKIGNSNIYVNKLQRKIEKPFLQNAKVFVPLKAFLEAYGAELNFKEKGKVELIYRDTNISFSIGNKTYLINDMSKSFSSAPKLVHNVLMVPVDFITGNFGGKLSYNKKDSTYTILLEDDGAITDFSSVIGSINRGKIGNSYFGWSLTIPKGSQIIENSFNSKDISIGNNQYGIVIGVKVSVDEGKKYQDFIDQMQNPNGTSSPVSGASGKILDSSINTTAALPYAEVLTSNYESGGIIRRFIISNGYVYRLTLSSTKEVNPVKLKKDAYLVSLLNSFKLGFKGSAAEVKDTSKVKDGVVKYIDTFYGFSFSTPPEWEVLSSADSMDIPTIKVGLNNKEYMSINPEFKEGITDIDKYGDSVKEFNTANFNSKLYSFIDKKSSEIAAQKACKLIYSLDLKDQKSIFEENLLPEGDIIYHITMKTSESLYSKKSETFTKVLNSIDYSPKNAESIKKYLEASKTDGDMSRVGKEDGLVDYTQKDYKWKMKIPGSWITIPYFEDNIKFFSEGKDQAFVGIEAVENNSDTIKQDDKTVFNTLKSIQDGKDNYKFISKEEITDKGTTIKAYKYRLEDDKEETYADVIHYVIRGDKYSYCFFYLLQDIYASETNIKEVTGIWNSFTNG